MEKHSAPMQPNMPSTNADSMAFLNSDAARLYGKMIEEVRDYAILLLDAEGNLLNWNAGAAAIKGYAATDIVGKHFSTFYTLEDNEVGLPALLINVAVNEGRAMQEGWRVKKDGSRFWASVVINALHDTDGTVIGFSKLTRDLTERKLAEQQLQQHTEALRQRTEELRKSEERYHRMIAEVEDYAIILLDTQGNILNWNKGAEKIKGYSEHEIVGKNFRQFYRKEDCAKQLPEQLLQQAALSNKANHEGWRVRKDGTEFWGSIVITALHDDHGAVIGYSKVTRDRTQTKQFEDFILTQNKQLHEFAYIASHDLQEPLRKIMIFSSRLQEEIRNNVVAKGYLDKVATSADRMSKLITAVLDYSRLEEGTFAHLPVDLNQMLGDITADFEIHLHEKDGTILWNRLPTISGIPVQLRQLFANLIGNAIKFSDTSVVITITSEILPANSNTETAMVKISVADNGPGFPNEYAEQIFKIFSRLQDKSSGTGIGLALCRKIAELHGGTITAASQPGIGTTFEILLPYQA